MIFTSITLPVSLPTFWVLLNKLFLSLLKVGTSVLILLLIEPLSESIDVEASLIVSVSIFPLEDSFCTIITSLQKSISDTEDFISWFPFKGSYLIISFLFYRIIQSDLLL